MIKDATLRMRKWRAKNREKAQEYSRQYTKKWRLRNQKRWYEILLKSHSKKPKKYKNIQRNAVRRYRKNNLEKARESSRRSVAKYRKKYPNKYREWRQKNLLKVRAKQLKRVKERREYIKKYKNKPCADCKGIFNPIAMDFDHVNGKKIFGVARMVSFSKKRLDDEIAKCEVVCANCHRIRTFKRIKKFDVI